MTTVDFPISEDKLKELMTKDDNLGKNSHIGNLAVAVVMEYFRSLDPSATFKKWRNGADIEVTHLNKTEEFEIKGTAKNKMSWGAIKVSSTDCYNLLCGGMTLIRVTNVGQLNTQLHFMKFKEDFDIAAEARYSVSKFKKLNP